MSKYSQEGGAIRAPYRWFNPEATAFQPCGSCQGCAHGPQISYNGKPKNGQAGGAIRMPYRFYNPNATAFKPCPNGPNQAGGAYNYFNDFACPNCQNYNSCSMQQPGCACARAQQKGGNAVGAPFYVFTEGNPMKYSYPIVNGPKFDKVGPNKFWCN